MATKTATMGSAVIGPSSWRNNTMNTIKLSQNVIQKSDKSADRGKTMDSLPNLRETLAELSNDQAHCHFRDTRLVVHKLREALIETNEEVKSLTRCKEFVEQAIDNARKDLQLNLDSQNIRQCRPQREKEGDGADTMLKMERQHLQNTKKMLENHLRLIQEQLLTLDRARKRLSHVISERARVLDLMSHGMPSRSALTSRVSPARRSRLTQSADFDRSPCMEDDNDIDPLGAFTPEVEAALDEAREARERSCMLRREAANKIGNGNKTQDGAMAAVNNSLVGKVGETVGLKNNLGSAAAENRQAINRAHRWFDQTEKAWGYSRGPLESSDLMVREKLDRPVIRTFQRHPGNNLPEAQHIVRGGDGLLQSLQSTSRNIGLLKLAQLQLKDDLRDKKSAIDIDSNIIRMRRRKANHRWVMGKVY